MLGACLQVAAYVHSQTVSFSGSNVSLEKIFSVVEKQTGYVFFYDEAILKDTRPVSIKAENYSLQLFLSCVLNDQPLKFSFQNKTIIISRKEMAAPPAADTTNRPAAQPMLGGIVTDMNNMLLSGASVSIKGTGKSTITNGKGVFSIPMPAAKSKVVVSYVGYTTREVELQEGQQQMFIQLTVAVNELDEEVVEAYGKTSKRLAVGNIVKVSGEDIQRQPVMNPLLALNGRVPGVLVTPTSGYQSAPVKVEIRGRNTLNPDLVSDPLYVIDGMPLTILDIASIPPLKSSYANGSTGFVQAGLQSNTNGQSPLFSINPADIESISVLKDAAATAIYGSRGANGVILITTKRTKPGKTRMEVNVQQAVSMAPKHWDMLKTPEYLQMRYETMKNDGFPLTMAYVPELSWDTTRYTDWQKELWGVAKTTDASMSVSGGDRLTSFNIGAGFTNSQDITTLKGKNQRISVSSTITHRSTDQKLSIDMRALYTNTYVSATLMPSFTTLPPNAPPIFNEKGGLNYAEWTAVGITSFPFATILQPSIANTNFINASLRLSYVFAKGLTASVNGGYNNAQANTEWYLPIASQNPVNNPTGTATFGTSSNNNWNVEPQLNYTTYVGSGRLEIMTGGTYQRSHTRGMTVLGAGFTNDALIHSINNAPVMSSTANAAQKGYASLHGRINYNWQNKYILELAGNRDGSSNFGPGKQFGNFWSAGAGWIASEEEWLQPLLPSWWSYLKLNGSYGVTGLDAGASYQYISEWSLPRTGMPNYNGIRPMVPAHAVNPDYQWQENKKINVDLNMGFLKDRITLTATWYRNRCNNQLTRIPIPSYTGFSTVVGNSPANVENSGWEGSLNAQVIATKAFSWTFGFNIGVNRNKLLGYPDFEFSSFYTTHKIGESLNTVYLYHYLGINPQNGRRAVYDYNHDGAITESNTTAPATGVDDKYIALDVTPRYSGGISSAFTYKRFALNLFFNFKKQMGQIPYATPGGGMGNIPTYVYNDHWQMPGDQTTYPRFSTVTTNNESWFNKSDGAYADASFIRCTNLAFSYSLTEAACKRLHIQGVALSLNMSNLFTITKYKGIDPETAFGILPQPRTIAGKLSFNF